jgi:hypothetical protein
MLIKAYPEQHLGIGFVSTDKEALRLLPLADLFWFARSFWVFVQSIIWEPCISVRIPMVRPSRISRYAISQIAEKCDSGLPGHQT